MSETIKVIFHRHYEVDKSIIHNRLKDNGYEDVDMTEDIMKETAEEIARYWLANEMPEFVDNTKDFVSATIEID